MADLTLDADKLPKILKECFLLYSFNIGNCFYEKNGEKRYRFNYTENTSLTNFSKLLIQKSPQYLNLNWIFDYFNYQFTYWDFIFQQKKDKGEDYLIQLHWILGQKALKRFLSRTDKDTYFYHSSFYPKYKINREDLFKLFEKYNFFVETEDKEGIEKKEQKLFLNDVEENIKKRKYNTLEGFYLCQEFSTLFKYNSPLCKKCNYKDICKKELKKNFPDLFSKRFAYNLKNKKNG